MSGATPADASLTRAKPYVTESKFPESPSSDPGAEEEPRFASIGPYSHERRAREDALVLQSMGIPHVVSWFPAGFSILVSVDRYDTSVRALAAYQRENRDWPPPRTKERLRYRGVPILAISLLGLLAFFTYFTGPVRSGGAWFREGTSVASLVVSSEPFRAVTALTLHADASHVIGNVLSGALFAHALERRLGPGVAALSVVSAGALGNLFNAVYYVAVRGEEHRSIGASTAVMAAIGALAVAQVVLGSRRSQASESGKGSPRRWFDIVAPIIGGLALLGTLGASAESDLGAHGFGFLAGLIVGVPAAFVAKAAWAREGWKSRAVDLGFGSAAVALVAGSWLLALSA